MNIVIYTNILTPYRKHFYDALAEECKKAGDSFKVLVMAETEANRLWYYNDLKTDYTILLKSITLSCGNIFVHFNRSLKQTLKSIQPDVIICAGSYLCPGIGEILSWRRSLDYKVYYWSESHLREKRNYSKSLLALRDIIRKNLYSKFDGFWYAGQLSKEFIEKYAKKNADYIFVPNVVDEMAFSKADEVTTIERDLLRKKLNISANNTVFITPARLSPVKGILEFLQIASKSQEKSKITWLIAGDGELKGEIQNAAKNAEINIRLVGYKTQSEMIELYALSDVFVMPSLSDPNPLTVIEALWSGLPILLSEHVGNYPETVQIGGNGYVFSYQDKARAIEYVSMLVCADNDWFLKAKQISKDVAQKVYFTKNVAERIINQMSIACEERNLSDIE